MSSGGGKPPSRTLPPPFGGHRPDPNSPSSTQPGHGPPPGSLPPAQPPVAPRPAAPAQPAYPPQQPASPYAPQPGQPQTPRAPVAPAQPYTPSPAQQPYGPPPGGVPQYPPGHPQGQPPQARPPYPPPPVAQPAQPYPPPPQQPPPGGHHQPTELGFGNMPPPAPPGQQPYPPPPMAGYPPPGSAESSISAVPGSTFGSFLQISMKRAFRLRIEPNEVLPSERLALEMASPPIRDAGLQAFLAWRRSLLLLVAVALVPLTIVRLYDAFKEDGLPGPVRMVLVVPALAEAFFCGLCWFQLKHWAHWRTQRRAVFIGWLVFLGAPFVVFAYPLHNVAEDVAAAQGAAPEAAVGYSVVFGLYALIALAPKAISLMPGLIRAGMVTKMLFPGTAGPGWLIVLSTPIYALFAYTILIVPYHITGSGWFIAGIIGLLIAQAILAKAGYALAKPISEQEAVAKIRQTRNTYLVVMGISALLIVIALARLAKLFNLGASDVITTALAFYSNVLILTMIGSDLVITNLDRARGMTAGTQHLEDDANMKLASFVGHDAPTRPPPMH